MRRSRCRRSRSPRVRAHELDEARVAARARSPCERLKHARKRPASAAVDLGNLHGPTVVTRAARRLRAMPSERQIMVGDVPIGGGAPVAVQTMTKTETANLTATMDQIRTVAEAGADIVRVAVPREQDAAVLAQIVAQSPIPVIADIHFNYTLALKAIDAGAPACATRNPGATHRRAREGRDRRRASQGDGHAAARRRQLRIAAASPPRARVHQPRRGARQRRGGDGRA